MRAELRGLPKELADIVAAHLLVAGELIDSDPELAYRHAEAARRRAARVAVVREAAAETAYAAGHYDVALSEYRALRRMTGQHGFLAVMADCERALGQPQAAIKLAREADGLNLEPADRIELTIVESGARNDLGQGAEAIRLLRELLSRLPDAARPTSAAAVRAAERLLVPQARVHYALADLLLGDGDPAGARIEFARAAELDTEDSTDASDRLDELDGVSIEFDEFDDPDQSAQSGESEQQSGQAPSGDDRASEGVSRGATADVTADVISDATSTATLDDTSTATLEATSAVTLDATPDREDAPESGPEPGPESSVTSGPEAAPEPGPEPAPTSDPTQRPEVGPAAEQDPLTGPRS